MVAKWMGYIYLPIALLALGIFLLVEWNTHNIDSYNESQYPVATSTTPSH